MVSGGLHVTALRPERRLAHLALALAIVLVCAAVLYLVLSAITPNKDVALGFAALAIAFFPPIDQYLEIREVTVNLSGLPRRRAASLEQFSIPWYVLLAYGSLLLLMLHQVTGAVYLVAQDHTQFSTQLHILFNASTGMIIQNPSDVPLEIPPLIGMFFLGRWIAIRSAGKAAFVIVGAAFAGHFLALLAGVLTSGHPDDGIPVMSGMMTDNTTPSLWSPFGFLYWVVPTAGAFSVVGLIGWWRGHSQRLMRYADYLLNRLPSETRLTVVGMLYDECGRSIQRSEQGN
jgi:hypothetical protein